MPTHSNILSLDRTKANLECHSKKRALQIGSEIIARDNEKIEEGVLFEHLMERERLGSTSLGEGVAIPHCRLEGLRETTAAFITLANPVDFEAPDQQPVDLVFILVVPLDENEEHLQILARLSKIFQDADTRQTLRSIRGDTELYETMKSLLDR